MNKDSIVLIFKADFRKIFQRYCVKAIARVILITTEKVLDKKIAAVET